VLLLAPVPARLKEWAYRRLRHRPRLCAAATGVLWGLSYFLWRRLEATPARA